MKRTIGGEGTCGGLSGWESAGELRGRRGRPKSAVAHAACERKFHASASKGARVFSSRHAFGRQLERKLDETCETFLTTSTHETTTHTSKKKQFCDEWIRHTIGSAS